MGIKTFIQQQVLVPRLRQARGAGVLVVYDPERRYRELCLELAEPARPVIDASESSIESREAAMGALQALGQPGASIRELLIYVPVAAPVRDEERMRDPFAVFGACGAVFPDGDGDEYLSLCLRARADHATQIRRIFQQQPNPDFAVIDAVGGGAGWPHLQTRLRVESARDLLFALLAPTDRQREALKGQDAWAAEARALFESALGLKLSTRAVSWSPIADELWRFLLFSEFVFDLPGALPAALADMPRAAEEARPLVEDLCDRLRNDRRTQALYIDRAEGIERELNLAAACEAIEDLGIRDTFPFEDRSYFTQAVDALKRDNVDRLRHILAGRAHSVWGGRAETQSRWALLEAAARLVGACDDAARELPDHLRSQDSLIDFYLSSLREVDRLVRELEQVAGDYLEPGGPLAEVRTRARAAYQKLMGTVQGVFIKHLEKAGWPPSGRLANADVFDRLVAPRLSESGRRVAMLWIDALRYELGIELRKLLEEDGPVELQAAFASMPSITVVGMASLLPGAGGGLELRAKDGQLVPVLGGLPVSNVGQRMEVLRRRYGQRFAEQPLAEFVRSVATPADTVELLVLRSNEIDSDFESNPEAAPGLIGRTFQKVRAALQRLRALGFHEAVIVTDHGFVLNTAIGPGDVSAKPPGQWVNVHERLLLGDGAGDVANFVVPAGHLGIKGDFSQVAGPRALVAYRAGQWYFHGGASLQEGVVPVLTMRFQAAGKKFSAPPAVTVSYKSRKLTTRLPVFDLSVGEGDLFSRDQGLEVLLEAHDKKGAIVGEARPGGPVNPATRIVTLKPGERVKVTLKMDLEFEGKLTVKALDPVTSRIYHKLDLETDYAV